MKIRAQCLKVVQENRLHNLNKDPEEPSQSSRLAKEFMACYSDSVSVRSAALQTSRNARFADYC
jgi:hypothetical protein